MKEKSCALALVVVLFALSQACAAATSPNLIKQLETISESIGKHTDIHALSDSLYRQLRPNVLVNNKNLSRSQIDRKVRTYIEKKYVPILVMNYSLQYSKMKKAGVHFDGCKSLHALPFNEHTDMALCTSKTQKNLAVRYMTRHDREDWNTTSVYEFSNRQHDLILTAIHLNLKKDQKFRIYGI